MLALHDALPICGVTISPGVATSQVLGISGDLTDAARSVSLTNTSTSTASLMDITLRAGSTGSGSFGFGAPEYTGVPSFKGRAFVEADGSGDRKSTSLNSSH